MSTGQAYFTLFWGPLALKRQTIKKEISRETKFPVKEVYNIPPYSMKKKEKENVQKPMRTNKEKLCTNHL